MKRVLFQGDSITDAIRSRDSDEYRGSGYATLVSARLSCDNPGEFEFINRGVSGDKILQILARIKADIINLKPDIMSILVGVNDVWHGLARNEGTDAELYEHSYNFLIDEVQRALPNTKIMILEPYVCRGEATADNFEEFHREVLSRAAAAKRVAEKHGLKFVPLQKVFDDAEKKYPSQKWLIDGVHPAAAGHELIAREWISAYNEIK